MIFEWETDEERLLRFMKIPPKKKMEWLNQMNRFLNKVSTKKQKDIYLKIREER